MPKEKHAVPQIHHAKSNWERTFDALPAHMSITKDAAGQTIKICGTNQDITKRTLLEAEHERLLASLESKNTELESFTYTVSHDQKSPLITIQTYVGMIIEDMEAGNHLRAQDDIKRIGSAAAKMTVLLDDLLTFSRSGRSMGQPEPVEGVRVWGNLPYLTLSVASPTPQSPPVNGGEA